MNQHPALIFYQTNKEKIWYFRSRLFKVVNVMYLNFLENFSFPDKTISFSMGQIPHVSFNMNKMTMISKYWRKYINTDLRNPILCVDVSWRNRPEQSGSRTLIRNQLLNSTIHYGTFLNINKPMSVADARYIVFLNFL